MVEPLEELMQIALKRDARVTPFVLEYLNMCKQYMSYNLLDVEYVLKEIKNKYS